MKKIYYVFGSGNITNYVSDNRCIYYLPRDDYEEMIDLSLMDSLHEKATVFFVGFDAASRALAQATALRYGCEVADSVE